MKNKVKLAHNLKVKKLTEEDWEEIYRLSDKWGKAMKEATKNLHRLTAEDLATRLD